ncbi:MAG: hypothetical protein ICV83_05275 [Cytophagales bacterium]|nr:hypothetical protein [Cytophagales bacterium]
MKKALRALLPLLWAVAAGLWLIAGAGTALGQGKPEKQPKPDSREYQKLKKEGKLAPPAQAKYKGQYPGLGRFSGKEKKTGTVMASTLAGQTAAAAYETCTIAWDESYVSLPPNDDAHTSEIALPFGFTFFGQTYRSVYINNNGNISFGQPYSTYTSTGFPVNNFPMIAPFWSDVDTRGTASGTVHYKVEDTRLTVIWENVGYYDTKDDKRNTFKLIITSGSDLQLGQENNVAFVYGDMQWTTGDRSGVVDGFGGVPATAGINRGNGVDFYQLGRFNQPGFAYDGPGETPDGVDYLDYRCYEMKVDVVGNNAPPIAEGFPANYTLDLEVGQQIILPVRFLSPELLQTTAVTTNAGSVTGFSLLSNTPGNVANVVLQLDGTDANVGEHQVEFVATDNGTPAQSTRVVLTVRVHPPRSLALSPIAGGPYCPGGAFPIYFTPAGRLDGGVVAQLSEVDSEEFPEDPVVIGSAATGPMINAVLPLGIPYGTYQVRIVSGETVSEPTELVLRNTLTAPAFATNLAGTSACAGTQGTFSVTNPGDFVYTWRVSGANTGTGRGTTFAYTFRNAGNTTVTLVAGRNGCSASAARTYTIRALPTLTAEALRGATCSQARDGRLRFTTNGNSYSLLRNGSPYEGPFALSGTSNTITRDNLLPGSYKVVVRNSFGCTAESAAIAVTDGSPVVTTCTNYLRCTGSTTPVLHFQVNYPLPPSGFTGKYSYRVLKNGVQIVNDTLPAPAAGSGDGVYNDATAPWPYTVAIPGADTVSTYTLEVSALVTGGACNCVQPYCKKETPFYFTRPPVTLAVDAVEQLNGRPVYYVCGANARAAVGVTLSSLLNGCSDPYQGYRLSVRKAGQAPVTVRDTAGTLSNVQDARTLSLAAGTYTLEAELGTGNYRCAKQLTFEVKSLDLTVSVSTTPADCREGATATAVVAGTSGAVSYRWLKTRGSTVGDTLAAAGARVDGLAAGSYRLEISVGGIGVSCRQATDFTVRREAEIDTVLVTPNGCEAVAKAQVPTPGTYRVEWHRYDTLATGSVRDTVLLSTHVSTGGSLVAALPEAYLADSAYYYAQVYNPEGCAVASADTYLKRPKVERLYALCLQWETPPIPPVTAPPVAVQTGPVIAATHIREAIEEKVAACVTRQTAVAVASFAASCTTDSTMQDVLTLTYPQHDQHYTLYYYDRAGRLARTVPPAGVTPLTGTALSRNSHPAHSYVTTYDYNSLDQLVRQHTPDGDSAYFVYNNLGQLRFSQNARQKADKTFSYTTYDHLGRILQVGQALPKAGTDKPVFALPSVNAANDALLAADKAAQPDGKYPTPTQAAVSERTVTVYSEARAGVSYFGLSSQQHLRNRVSYTYTYNLADSARGVYTYYSYDPHGNVTWLVQETPGLGRNYVAYEYDLISGKVLKVKYNEFRADKFFHQYHYDEDNRLTGVQTSRDGLTWERDASYAYYDHGPLRRMGIGEDKVQGVDYAYTIHGWLKGINALGADPGKDLGKDGGAGSDYSPDEFGMTLGYYAGDYRHKSSVFDATAGTTNKYNLSPEKDLYNGNISTWVSHLNGNPAVAGSAGKTDGYQYGYDRLNRLRESKHQRFTATDSLWHQSTAYRSNYRYDGNGNLLGLQRYDEAGKLMDDLAYTYNGTASARKNNRLEKVTDRAGATPYGEDLEGESSYAYDPTGNLVQDRGDSVQISWNVYGKVSELKPLSGSNKPYLRYLYDAAGNRILKEVNAGPADRSQPEKIRTTYYVRDAQGNILSVYEQVAARAKDTLRTCPPDLVLEAAAGYNPDTRTDGALALTSGAVTVPDTVRVTVGNAADGLVGLTYRKDDVRKTIFYRGLAAGPHGVSLPNAYVRYNDTTALKTLLPALFPAGVTAASLVDASSTAKHTLRADSLVLHVYGGDSFAPAGEGSTGNETRVQLVLEQPCREVVRMVYHHKEVPVYGSDRVGQYTPDSLVYRAAGAVLGADTVVAAAATGYAYRETGLKQYELKDHLGNVRVVVGDGKLADVSTRVRTPGDTLVNLLLRAGVRSQSNYYPFGMTQPGGSYLAQGAEGYRYGFNGQEKDNELKGYGNSYDFMFRIYDPRLGKFLSVDPLFKDYAWNSPYAFAENRVIDGKDLEGKEYENYQASQIVKSKGVAALKIINADHGLGPLVKANYSLQVHGSGEAFKRLKEAYTTDPGIVHNPNNDWAKYTPLKRSETIQENDHMKILISVAFGYKMDIYVRFTNVNVSENSFSIRASTLYGHTDAGFINFSGSFDPETGTINFSIYNETTSNVGSDVVGFGRYAQTSQWKAVLDNVESYLGGETESKTLNKRISTQDAQQNGGVMKVVDEDLQTGSSTESYSQIPE